jgi:hypothetical protein
LVAAAGVAVVFASTAAAYGTGPFCTLVLIDSGHTCLASAPRNIIRVYGQSVMADGGAGNAATCVGGKTYQSADAPWSPPYVCGNPGQVASTPTYSNGWGCCTWPAIHNHSTFLSRFSGHVDWYG